MTSESNTIWDNIVLSGEVGEPGFDDLHFSECPPSGGLDGLSQGNAIANVDQFELINTILGRNNSTNAVHGSLQDNGHNICADASASFSVGTSRNNT